MGLPPTVQKYDHDSDSLYSVRGLTKVYGEGPTAVHALRGVDLDLPKSAMVVLLGASGSGKSTFLNIVGGLDDATDGQVFFEGSELTSLGPSQLTEYRRNSVSFVFQFYARAVAKRPKVMFCDEPTGALDSQTGVIVLDALDQINRELGTTTLLITHNVVIADMADRLLRFADGALVEDRANPDRVAPAELKW